MIETLTAELFIVSALLTLLCTMAQKEKIILGIDPGTTVMGYGVIQISNKKMELVTMGILQLSKYKDHMLKLKHIFERSLQLIDSYHPDELAIEAPFYGKKRSIDVKTGKSTGYQHRCRFVSGYSHF
jgi:crossover junction endodeoxyribonuclease RuvC